MRLFVFFQVQGFGVAVMSLPFLVVARNDAGLGAWSWTAVAVWAIAVVGEATADRQLAAFRAEPVDQGDRLRDGAVALVAASELLLRVAALVDVRASRRSARPGGG